MKRYEDWPNLLHKAIDTMRTTEFAYGQSDCALGSCSVIKDMTGVDPAEELRGTYHDERAAEKLVEKHGSLEALAEKVAKEHGLHEIDVHFARRGDVVLMETNTGPAIGIVDMSARFAVFPAHGRGLARLSMKRAKRAWRV